MSPTLQITQTRSPIGSQDGHRRTLRALGLRRIHHSVNQPDRPEIRGMISKVAHLVDVAYVGGDDSLDLEPGQEPKGEGNPPAGQTVGDEEAAEIAEGIEQALSAEGSVDDVGDLVDNPPSLAATDEPGQSRSASGGSARDQTYEAPAEEEEGS